MTDQALPQPAREPARGPARDPQGRLLIDVRGPRFSAAITATVLALALVLQGRVGVALLTFQVVVFSIAAFAGLRWSVYGNVFRFLKRRLDLGPPPDVEPEGPPRFSQLMGFLFTGAGLVAIASGARTLGWILAGMVLALSSLLALTGICVGCEMYLLGQRLRPRGAGR